ncbi:AraC family transcriptional regulator [Vibrio sp. ZSDE26]|uniref:AraC family transcriptional regulator n=1 Tax=Vibrio amylolyticus TaxID=2847292 RepID=A0A9X1XI19_9VIBR|nr:AraC family transcriptional regulator [Vibrio amylolyticus]MCK6262721.1 AraC family transcriptional regulator [Vibrio amylolyticus]
MLESKQNLFESVIDQDHIKTQWQDQVFLSDECRERFLGLTEIPEFESMGFFMAGMADLVDGYIVERESVAVHTLLFTLKGEGLLTLADQRQTIPANSLVILPADMPFRFELGENSNKWKMVWLLLSPSDKWHSIIESGQRVVQFHHCEQVWSLMSLLHHEISGRASYRKLLSSEISRLLNKVEVSPSNSSMRVRSVWNLIESQLHLSWSVKKISQQCFLSEEQLNRLSKSLFGQTPQERLIHLRMEKAAELLHHQEWSITMIAQRLGYKDPYAFSHRFKRYFGVSPRAYRKQLAAR